MGRSLIDGMIFLGLMRAIRDGSTWHEAYTRKVCQREPFPMAQKEESYDKLQRISSMQINKFVWRVNNNEK